jgi:hypothetical protein
MLCIFLRTKAWAFSLAVLLTFTNNAIAQVAPEDEDNANIYARKYKDDDVICKTAYHYYSFDKGKNSLGDKVVEIQEESEYEFMSLKKYSGLTHVEFYNKFMEIKNFKKSTKYGKKFYTEDKTGYDRSVTDDNIFFDDSRVRYFPIRFNQKGQVTKVNVKKVFFDSKYLTKFFFHSSYPMLENVYEFKVPEWINIDFKSFNFKGFDVEATNNKKGNYTTYIFRVKNLSAYKSEYRRIGRAYTDPHVVIQVKSFTIGAETIKGFENVSDVYAWNNRLYSKAENDLTPLKTAVTKITKGKTTDVDKIKAIYYWVQDNVRYIAYEDGYSGYIPATVQDVLSKKYGDCKGMANLLTEMLKIAGYDARFTWIGTRSIPYSQTLAAMCVNNHAICALNFVGKTYFLDGTESYGPFGENAFRIQGKEALIAKGTSYEIVKVPEASAAENIISTKADFVLNNTGLKGKAKVLITGNNRTAFHQSYQLLPSTTKKEFLNDYLEFGNDNLLATNIKTSDLNNRDLPVTIEGDIDLSNTVNTISGNQYVGIDFFPKTLDRFIPDEKRVEGYDLDDVLSFEDELSLSIPADKKFTDKPDDMEIMQKGYEFKGTYTIVGNKIILKKSLKLKNNIIEKKDLAEWTKFIESIKEFNKYFISIINK